MTILTGILGIVGILLLGGQAYLPGHMAQWLESNKAPLVEVIAVIWAVLYFVAWKPYCRSEDQSEKHREEIDGAKRKITELEKQIEPKLALICSPDVEACSFDRARQGTFIFRTIIKNIAAHQGITGCRLRLTRVERGSATILNHVLWDLPPSGIASNASLETTIMANDECPFDVLVVQANSTPQQVWVPRSGGGNVGILTTKTGEAVFRETGEYVLTVNAFCHGPSKPGKLKFNWTGNYADSKLSLIE